MDKENLGPDTIVDFIGDIFARRGAEEYLGEPLTISQHMLQCANCAVQDGEDEELVAAALLHDIGHFTNEFPDDAADQGIDALHEEAGARVLERFFSPLIHDCVRYHVAAKRYLCATDDSYFGKLSPASVHSLNLQGGPMTEAEAEEFAQNPHLEAILKVRIWDDVGKNPDDVVPGFDHYRGLLQRIVDAHAA